MSDISTLFYGTVSLISHKLSIITVPTNKQLCSQMKWISTCLDELIIIMSYLLIINKLSRAVYYLYIII